MYCSAYDPIVCQVKKLDHGLRATKGCCVQHSVFLDETCQGSWVRDKRRDCGNCVKSLWPYGVKFEDLTCLEQLSYKLKVMVN